MSRFYKEAKENKRLTATRCPKCNELLFEPKIVCGKCKVRAGDELIDIGDKGTVHTYNTLIMRFWNGWTGDFHDDPHPVACIKLDSGVYLEHCLEETDFEKLKQGMRVQAVWKPDGERGGGASDILYFRTIEE